MGSSSSLANTISFVASIVYFLFILLQIPLFRLPCKCGICRSPIQVTCSQLTATKIIPIHIAELLLYPGVFLKTTFSRSYRGSLDICDMTRVEMNYRAADIRQLEILIGSYLSVSGALLGLLKQGRMSLFGMLLLVWGLTKEVFHARGASGNAVKIYPALMLFALLAAFLCVRRDMKMIIRSFRAPYDKARPKRS